MPERPAVLVLGYKCPVEYRFALDSFIVIAEYACIPCYTGYPEVPALLALLMISHPCPVVSL